jgi:hypothetical protein
VATSPGGNPSALARWLGSGVTSATHPVLEWALRNYFHPVGVDAESLEAEPFSALECGRPAWWLRRPTWNPARIDRRSAAWADFEPLVAAGDGLVVEVDARGHIAIAAAPGRAEVPAGGDGEWNAARHTVRAAQAAEAFIFTAAALVLVDDPTADLYAAGDERAFCERVVRRLAPPG